MSAPTPQQIQWYKEHASDNLQPNMIAAAVCGLVIAYSAVVLRVVARRASAARTGIDDWLIIAALLPLTGYAISIFLAVRYNGGRHIIFLTQPRSFIERYIAGITAYAVCVVLTKSSILCFYNRIFPSKVLLRVSWAFGLFIGAYNLALVLVTALQCIPLSSFWTHKPAKCIQTRSAFTILAVINLITDVLILILPIKYVWNLQMRPKRKVQVCGIFLLGAVVCVFGLVRAIAISTTSNQDITYKQVQGALWSNAEIAVGIVAACLPTLGMLFSKKKLAPSTAPSTSAQRFLHSIRSKLTLSSARSSQKSSRNERDVSLQDWSSKPGYQVWSSAGNRTVGDSASSERSFVKNNEGDIEYNGETMERQHQTPSQIRVKQELHQSYS